LTSAPSQYVEVVPTASSSQRSTPAAGAANASSGPSSALGAAADAIASGDDRYVLGLGAAMLMVTLWLVGAAAIRCWRS
jgi:hypothetical protein